MRIMMVSRGDASAGRLIGALTGCHRFSVQRRRMPRFRPRDSPCQSPSEHQVDSVAVAASGSTTRASNVTSSRNCKSRLRTASAARNRFSGAIVGSSSTYCSTATMRC